MAKKVTSTKKSTQPKKPVANIRVKKATEVLTALQNFLAYNLHDRYNFTLAKQTQKKIVAYGPWLATLLVVVGIPELLVLAKTGGLITLGGFFNTIFFNQQSWVILIILFVNILLLVDGIGHLFAKARRGWNNIYLASLITSLYAGWQLIGNITEPAAPILSLTGLAFTLFVLLDIRHYYN